MADASATQKRIGACQNCRRKKQKCGLERPECSRCRNCKLACSYPTSRRRPGPAKGSVPGRMTALHERIGRLESLLRSHAINPDTGQYDSNRTPSSAGDATSNLGSVDLAFNDFELLDDFDANAGTSPDMNAPLYDVHFDEPRTYTLLELYFATIQPMFPMFRQREFFQDFANNTLPPDLIIVMMGLALRASGQSEDQSLLNEIKRIERNLEKKDLDYRNILLSEIKLACLCIIHQFASGPNQYTWMVMGKLARTVYGCKLHQVDGGNGSGNGSGSEGAAHPYFPLASLEELRYVWWTAVRIDMFINVLTCMPCTLDVETAATSLPCTSVSDFTTGVEPDMSLKHIPRTNMIAFWDLLEEAHSAPLADGQRLQLAMCLLLRETTRRLQVILSDIEDPSIETGVAGIQNKCTKICEVLPAWFLDPQLASQSYETMIQHRTRLETILQLRLCCMYSYVPLMCALNEREPNSHGKLVNLWDQFVLHLLAAVDIIRAMPASYYSICDPMMSSGVWILGCVLSLCMMYKAHIVPAIGTQASVTRAEMETGFQALMDTLVGFAKMWPTARKMRESLESVRGWHDLPLSLDEVLKLFGRFQTPLPIHNVDAASPETIYDFDVLGTCKVSLEKDIVTDPQLQPQEWWPIQ